MVTERTIINALIITASFLLVPFVISESLTVDYLPALCLVGFCALVISFFFIKENLVIAPLVGTSVLGVLNFLPLPLTATHIACILVTAYYITGYVIIRQKRISVGKPAIFWPIFVVVGIVLFHNHSLSLGSLGGSSEGAKPAILMYLVTLGYFCGINLPTPSVRVLSRIPFYCVMATALSSVPYLLTTVVPGLAPALYNVTDNVNIESYSDYANGGTGGVIAKMAAFGPLGSCVQLYLLCYYPIATWLRPDRWWIIWVTLICMALTAASGYRSDVFGYFCTFIIASWCHYSWRALIVPTAIVGTGMVLLIASSNNLIDLPVRNLPMITQRTLSFLPADWDPVAIESGKGSNEFRDNIEEVYIAEYMKKSPLIGNGFTIDLSSFNRWSDPLTSGRDAKYAQAKLFIEGKMFHTGWLSVYDCVGIIGGLAFIALGFNLTCMNCRLLVNTRAGKQASQYPGYVWLLYFLFASRTKTQSTLYPTYVWILSNLITGLIAYFTVFGSFPSETINMLVTAIVLSHLTDLANNNDVPIAPVEMQGHVEMPRISGAYYGRR